MLRVPHLLSSTSATRCAPLKALYILLTISSYANRPSFSATEKLVCHWASKCSAPLFCCIHSKLVSKRNTSC